MTRFCVWMALALAGVACSTDDSVSLATRPDGGQGGFGGLGAGGSAGGGAGTTGTGGAFEAGTADGNSPDVSVTSDGGISDAPVIPDGPLPPDPVVALKNGTLKLEVWGERTIRVLFGMQSPMPGKSLAVVEARPYVPFTTME